MQELNTSQMEKFLQDLESIIKEAPEKRREMHEELAGEMETLIDVKISGAGFKDGGAKLRSYQESDVGSKGGYAVVRARKDPKGPNGAGAVTNYNENGHRIRSPSGHGKNYRPRIKQAYVNGRHFYSSARPEAESKAISIAERFVNELADKIEG